MDLQESEMLLSATQGFQNRSAFRYKELESASGQALGTASLLAWKVSASICKGGPGAGLTRAAAALHPPSQFYSKAGDLGWEWGFGFETEFSV